LKTVSLETLFSCDSTSFQELNEFWTPVTQFVVVLTKNRK